MNVDFADGMFLLMVVSLLDPGGPLGALSGGGGGEDGGLGGDGAEEGGGGGL